MGRRKLFLADLKKNILIFEILGRNKQVVLSARNNCSYLSDGKLDAVERKQRNYVNIYLCLQPNISCEV